MYKRVKNYFFQTFREIFVYHHTSLEFRAKTYALILGTGEDSLAHYQEVLEAIASEIYAESDRAEALILTVNEYASAVMGKKKLTDEALLIDIIRELRLVPRYALKIEPEHLRRLHSCTVDPESQIYQQRIIGFLEEKRNEFETLKR